MSELDLVENMVHDNLLIMIPGAQQINRIIYNCNAYTIQKYLVE